MVKIPESLLMLTFECRKLTISISVQNFKGKLQLSLKQGKISRKNQSSIIKKKKAMFYKVLYNKIPLSDLQSRLINPPGSYFHMLIEKTWRNNKRKEKVFC